MSEYNVSCPAKHVTICFSKSACSGWGGDDKSQQVTANSWIFITIQTLFALALVFLLAIRMYKYGDKEGEDEIVISKDSKRLKKERLKNDRRRSMGKKMETRLILDFDDEPLTDTNRSESNFMKSNADSGIKFPSKSLPEYVPSPDISIIEFLRTLSVIMRYDKYTQNRVIGCTVLSLFSSSASSILAMMFRFDRACKIEMNLQDDLHSWCNMQSNGKEHINFNCWLIGFIDPYKSALDAFKFLPIFLILAYMAFLVDRWRTFMVTCHTIQGRIQDLGVLLGSIPKDPVSTDEKKQLYKVYRFLNVIHIACYRSFMRDVFKDDDEKLTQMVKMNLLSVQEGIHFGSMGKKIREGLCSKILCEIDALASKTKKKFVETKVMVINDKICELRGTMACLHDTFVRDNPNEYIVAMNTLVYLYILLVLASYPLLMYSDSASDWACFQPMAFFGTWCTLLSMQIPYTLFVRLNDPFDAKDDINVENLIASTELALFQSMRCQFSAPTPEHDKYLPLPLITKSSSEEEDVSTCCESTFNDPC